MRIGGAMVLAGALALSGCGDDYVANSQGSVLLIVDSVNEGGPVLSDVRSENNTIVNCDVVVSATVILKNPGASGSALDDVTLSSYTVKYTRTDGLDSQGVDVPYEISGAVTQTITAGGSSDVSITMVRHQAKIEPPLNNIIGLDIVTMNAVVTLFGRTVNGDGVAGSGAVQITFADYGDGTQTCESGT